jgi:hypothetical protein
MCLVKIRPWLVVPLLLCLPAAIAQTNPPQFWISKTSSILYRITLRGERVRAEKVFPPEFEDQVEQGAFVRCDYERQKDTWAGKCESRLPLETAKDHIKWCKFKFSSTLTLFTPMRIEGESDVWGSNDVDVQKCEVRKSHAQRFVWVPKS